MPMLGSLSLSLCAGSGWAEYKQSGTVCTLPLPTGLRESDALPNALFTPSTKAAVGEHGM
jgi:phosphoribosylaminoimidazole-succinocarboxamide synthase